MAGVFISFLATSFVVALVSGEYDEETLEKLSINPSLLLERLKGKYYVTNVTDYQFTSQDECPYFVFFEEDGVHYTYNNWVAHRVVVLEAATDGNYVRTYDKDTYTVLRKSWGLYLAPDNSACTLITHNIEGADVTVGYVLWKEKASEIYLYQAVEMVKRFSDKVYEVSCCTSQ